MTVGDVISVKGCFTKEKFVAGRTLREIEKILGFYAGRLASGVTMVTLLELPETTQFDIAAYSNLATHRFALPTDLNIDKLKSDARATWATSGFERLVKALPTIRHDAGMDPDIQYPPGLGAPQWISNVDLRAKVVAIVTGYPDGRYVPAS